MLTNGLVRTLRYLSALLVLAALLVYGCRGHENWQFSVGAKNGVIEIDMDGVTLVFDAVSAPNDAAGGGARGSLTIAGMGTSKMTATALGYTFVNSYEGGVNTLTFEGHTLKLLDAGSRLEVGATVFDLSGSKKTVVIGADGSAKLRTP